MKSLLTILKIAVLGALILSQSGCVSAEDSTLVGDPSTTHDDSHGWAPEGQGSGSR